MLREPVYGVGLNGEEPRHGSGDHDVATAIFDHCICEVRNTEHHTINVD